MMPPVRPSTTVTWDPSSTTVHPPSQLVALSTSPPLRGPETRGLPLWNAPYTAFPGVVVTARLGMDRLAQCVPDIERLDNAMAEFASLRGTVFPGSFALHPGPSPWA